MKRRQWTPKEKLAIVLQGLKGEISVAELCNQHQISQSQYYKWRDRLLAEGGLVEKLTARNGPLEQLADVADTLNRLAPGLEALAPTIETLREAVTTLSLVVNPLSNIADRIPIPGRRRYSAPRSVPSERIPSDRLVHDEDE